MRLPFFSENSVLILDPRTTLFHDPSVKSSLSTIRSILLSFCLSFERSLSFQHSKAILSGIYKSTLNETKLRMSK